MSETKDTHKLDLRERGLPRDGKPQISERRIYMQLQAFADCDDPEQAVEALRNASFESVVYADVNDPRGIAVLVVTEFPDTLVEESRTLFLQDPFRSLTPKPDLTMFGRTYSTGFEPDLEDMLLVKPRRNAMNPEWPWAVWYPLRRKPEFGLLSHEENQKILGEHSGIGRAYGRAGYAHDVRLACHGLDRNDNDFVIGLIGAELYPLSRVVQEMRKTQQTAKYIQSLGPFFVGKTIWQSPTP